jgi:hypothetical protein
MNSFPKGAPFLEMSQAVNPDKFQAAGTSLRQAASLSS